MNHNKMTTEEFLKSIDTTFDMEAISELNGEKRKVSILQFANSLLAAGKDYAERFTYYLIKQDGGIKEESPLDGDESPIAKWAYDVTRLLAGLLGSDFNLCLGVLGLPLLDADPYEIFDVGEGGVRKQLCELGFPRISVLALKALAKRASDWGTSHNPVVMDNITESTDHLFIDTTDEEKCKEQMDKLLEVIDDTENHLRQGKAAGLDYHTQFIIDALWGFVPHPYPENYVDCAKAIFQEASQMMIPEMSKDSPDDEPANQFSRDIVELAKKIAVKYDVEFDDYFKSLSLSYMHYWGIHYFEIKTGQRTFSSNWNGRL